MDLRDLIGQPGGWAVGVLVVLVAAIPVCRSRASGQLAHDPVRMFSSAHRREGFQRAGRRCEFDSILWFRCHSPAEHADHFFPWVHGGATSMSNHVASCARHNLAKSDHMPTRMAAQRIERRRAAYFPDGCDRVVGQWYGRPPGVR